jgi:hypothetical protein
MAAPGIFLIFNGAFRRFHHQHDKLRQPRRKLSCMVMACCGNLPAE